MRPGEVHWLAHASVPAATATLHLGPIYESVPYGRHSQINRGVSVGHSTLTLCLSPPTSFPFGLSESGQLVNLLNAACGRATRGPAVTWVLPTEVGCRYTLPGSPVCTIPFSPAADRELPGQHLGGAAASASTGVISGQTSAHSAPPGCWGHKPGQTVPRAELQARAFSRRRGVDEVRLPGVPGAWPRPCSWCRQSVAQAAGGHASAGPAVGFLTNMTCCPGKGSEQQVWHLWSPSPQSHRAPCLLEVGGVRYSNSSHFK